MGAMLFHSRKELATNEDQLIPDSPLPRQMRSQMISNGRGSWCCTHRKRFNGGRSEVMAVSTRPSSNLSPHFGLFLGVLLWSFLRAYSALDTLSSILVLWQPEVVAACVLFLPMHREDNKARLIVD